MTLYRDGGKRLFDLAVSAALLPLMLPALALVATAVALRLGTPVLFRQERPGRGGLPFTLVKFRTMEHQEDEYGRALPDEKRLRGFGRLLRSTSLDELPEIWNVFKGDMSFVGPRPLLMKYLPRYTAHQARRHDVRPGITGWAQVNGRNAISWEDRFDLDVWYVENVSLALDVKILALTVWAGVTRRGVTYPGHATMVEFMGQSSDSGHPHGTCAS